jgi:hypothetical protein
MTPSALKDLLLSSFVVLLLLLTKQISAQPDTLIIYEYIRVVDTVWIEKDHSEIPQLSNIEPIVNIAIPPKPPKDLLVLQNHTPNSATLFENGIIKSENSNKVTMRRKGLFSMLLLPLHLVTFGQKEFCVHAGGNAMWLMHRTSTVSNPMWRGIHVGGEYLFPNKNSNVAFSLGTSASYLTPPSTYTNRIPLDFSLSELKYEFATIATYVMMNELNTGLFTSPYWQVSIPLKANIRLRNVQPFVGVEYTYSRFIFAIPERTNYSAYYNPAISFSDIEILMGVDYSISQKWKLRLSGSHGLIGKHNNFEQRIDPTLGVNEYFFKSANLDLSVVYTFSLLEKKHPINE